MLFTVLCSITGGMLAVLGMSRPDLIAWKFYRLVGVIGLTLGAAAMTWLIRGETISTSLFRDESLFLIAIVTTVCAMIIITAPLAVKKPLRFRALCFLGGASGIIAACIATWKILPSMATKEHALALLFSVVLSQTVGSLFVGSITLAWLLGHAYLTATRMTIDPLRRFSRLLIWFVNARLLGFAVSLGVSWLLQAHSAGPGVPGLLAQAWLIAVMRVGVGLILVSILAWMVNDCVRLRSTQSATGILYFASVAAYVGELAGQQLIRECRWPL